MSPTAREVLDRLEAQAGPVRPPVDGPFAFVLYEQIAYLASDERRAAAFAALEHRVGLEPVAILAATSATLVEICALGGIYPEERAERLKRSAAIALERCDGDLTRLARLPLAAARKIARSFDSFGAANAEALLLFAGVAVPALDSNGVRVFSRIWFGGETGRYASDHRRACASVNADGPLAVAELIRIYLAARRHGQTLCRRNAPSCDACPLQSDCAFVR